MKLLLVLLMLLALPAFAQADDNPLLSEGIWALALTIVGATAPVAWALIRGHLAARLDWKYRVMLDAVAFGVGYAWDAAGKEMKQHATAEGRKLNDIEAKELRKIAASAARSYALENDVVHPVLESERLVEPLINQAVVDAKVEAESARPRMRHGHKAVAT